MACGCNKNNNGGNMVLDTPDSQRPMNVLGNGGNNGMQSMNNLNNPLSVPPQSWSDLPVVQPGDPRSLILYSAIGGIPGIFARSTNFLATVWGVSPFVFSATNTKVLSLDTTDALSGVDALQWTFAHQMVNVSSTLAPPMRKVAFLRAGRKWNNILEFDMGVLNYSNVQLSFRNNLATSGTFLNGAAGTVPVISFTGVFTGVNILQLTLLQPGVYSMVLSGTNGGSSYAFEMEWIVLP